MKFFIALSLISIISAQTAHAAKPCYDEMSVGAYRAYAKTEKITIRAALEKVDLFVDRLKKTNGDYVYDVQLAEQCVGATESGYFPGTKFRVVLTESCELVQVLKLK